MKNILLILLSILLFACSDVEFPLYNAGDKVTLNDGRVVVIEKVIPSGYIVYAPNKFQIIFFQISINNIKK